MIDPHPHRPSRCLLLLSLNDRCSVEWRRCKIPSGERRASSSPECDLHVTFRCQPIEENDKWRELNPQTSPSAASPRKWRERRASIVLLDLRLSCYFFFLLFMLLDLQANFDGLIGILEKSKILYFLVH